MVTILGTAAFVRCTHLKIQPVVKALEARNGMVKPASILFMFDLWALEIQGRPFNVTHDLLAEQVPEACRLLFSNERLTSGKSSQVISPPARHFPIL